jgi:hypothetical protein
MIPNREALLRFIMSQRQNVAPDPARQMFEVAGTSTRPMTAPYTSANDMVNSAVNNLVKQKQQQAQASAAATAQRAAYEAELQKKRVQYGQQAASHMTTQQVAQSNAHAKKAATQPQATVSQTVDHAPLEQLREIATHPLQSITGRENNFDMLAGIPGYIATVAAPNTAYNLTVGLPDTISDAGTMATGAAKAIATSQPISEEAKQAALNTAGRVLDASAVLPVGKVFSPLQKVLGSSTEEVSMALKHALHSPAGQVAEQAAHQYAHNVVHDASHDSTHIANHDQTHEPIAQNLIIPGNTNQNIPTMNYNDNDLTTHAYGGLYTYAQGGNIHIDPSKKGTFKAQATRMHMGVQEAASHILANKEHYSPEMIKKATFAHNFAKQYGGNIENLAKFVGMYPLQKFEFAGTYEPSEPGFAPNIFPTTTIHSNPEAVAQKARTQVQQSTVQPQEQTQAPATVNWYVPQQGAYPQAQVAQAGMPQGAFQGHQMFAPQGNMPTQAMFDPQQMAQWLSQNPNVTGFTAAYPNGAPALAPGSVTYPISGGTGHTVPVYGGDLPTVQKSAVRPTKADPFGNGLSMDDVKKVQRELIESGLLQPSGKKNVKGEDAEIDGKWGPKTQKAYDEYIAKKNLKRIEMMPTPIRGTEEISMDQYIPYNQGNQTPAEPSPMPQRYANVNIEPRSTGSPLKTEKRGKDEKAYGGYMNYGGGWLDQYK